MFITTHLGALRGRGWNTPGKSLGRGFSSWIVVDSDIGRKRPSRKLSRRNVVIRPISFDAGKRGQNTSRGGEGLSEEVRATKEADSRQGQDPGRLARGRKPRLRRRPSSPPAPRTPHAGDRVYEIKKCFFIGDWVAGLDGRRIAQRYAAISVVDPGGWNGECCGRGPFEIQSGTECERLIIL